MASAGSMASTRVVADGRSLAGALREIVHVQAHLSAPISVLLAVAALAAVALPGFSVITQHLNTMAHEGAHAAVALADGRRVTGVALHRNGEGRTSFTPGDGFGLMFNGLAGYLGPSAVGLGAAWLIADRHGDAVLWLALAGLAALAVAARRSAFGLFAVILTGLVVFAVARYAPVGGQLALAYGIAWFLLLSGLAVVVRHGRQASDAAALRRLTHLPAVLWVTLWLTGTIAALALGARLLL